MARNPEPPKSALSFRIAAGLKDTLERLAEKDRRPLSQYVEMVLEDHVAKVSTGKKAGS